jgi:hypothetical protein
MMWEMYFYFRPLQAGSEQWFQGDISRVWIVLTDRYSGLHERSRIHPLFSLVCSSSVYVLRGLLRMDKEVAVHVWIAAMAGMLSGQLYATARLMRFSRFDALLIWALVLVSASSLFWESVPETKTVGAMSILICITAAAWHEEHPLADWVLVAIAAASLSMTVSNFMAGLALLVATRPVRRAVQLAVNAFFVVSILQIVQNFIYWRTTGMAAFRSETRFLFDQSAGTPLNKAIVSVFHSMVLPRVQTPIEFDTHTPMLSIQTSPIASSGAIELLTAFLWVAALTWGAVRLYRAASHSTAWKVVGMTAAGQVLFHLVYGDQTFLYTLHFLPLLVLTAALVVRDDTVVRGRLLLTAVLALCVVNNASNVRYARQALDRIVPLSVPIEGLPGR